MADTRISELTTLSEAPASDDLFVVVDVSDTTMAASGTNKKVLASNVVPSSDRLIAATGNNGVYLLNDGTGPLVIANDKDYPTAGNARGQGAVDLQTWRSSVIQVASGVQAVLVGGACNIASGNDSAVIGGVSNTANGYYSAVVGGRDNRACDTSSAVVGGHGNTTYGFYSAVVGGGDNRTSGMYSVVAGGRDNKASGIYSVVAGGRYAVASQYGQHAATAVCRGDLPEASRAGTIQRWTMTLGAVTDGAVSKKLCLDTAAPTTNGSWVIAIPIGKTCLCTIKTLAVSDGVFETACWEHRVIAQVRPGTTSGDIIAILDPVDGESKTAGTQYAANLHDDTAGAWKLSYEMDGWNLAVKGYGEAGSKIVWNATVEAVEVYNLAQTGSS